MKANINPNITSSVNDDALLTKVSDDVYQYIMDNYMFKVPDNWNFELGNKKITFDEICNLAVKKGISVKKIKKYYGQDCRVECDCHIIYLTVKDDTNTINRYPLFIGEMKKQGTNDLREQNGLKRQSVGNAGPDRVAKNFKIFAVYCILCDNVFFPYNVFLHGCDFGEKYLTKTTISKLEPFFGELNNFNPFFDKEMPDLVGGSCFYQNDDFSYDFLYNECSKCCEEGIKHYLERFGE